MEKDGKESFLVSGYAFRNEEDAKLAEIEKRKIEYLKQHLDTNKPETVLALYTKAVNERLFKTPLGIEFLRELQDYLINQADYSEDEVPPIRLFFHYESPLRDKTNPARSRVIPEKKKERVAPLFISVVFNLALLAAVIAMFYITLNSEQPNILNYETAITNRYATWEQSLAEKETSLRKKELELKKIEESLGVSVDSVTTE
jgi:hypothetical protein